MRRAEEALEHLGVTNAEDPTGESGEQIPVRAPFAGVVLERLVTTGTAVTPGTALFVVSDLSTLWALAEVDETALARVAVEPSRARARLGVPRRVVPRPRHVRGRHGEPEDAADRGALRVAEPRRAG